MNLALLPAGEVDTLVDLATELIRGGTRDEDALFMLAATLKESLLPESRPVDQGDLVNDPRCSICMKAFDRLVEINPEEPAHLWNRAMFKQSLGLPVEAASDLEAFLAAVSLEDAVDDSEYRSWVAAAYDHLGSDYLTTGRTIDAYKALKKAIELNPWYSYAWADLSKVYEALGNQKKARECAGRARALEE